MFVLAVLVVAVVLLSRTGLSTGDRIERLVVDGVITENRERDEALKKIADDPKVKALLVVIDSPGGTVVGGEALYERLRTVAAKKPVVTVMGTVAASAAYMTAIAADRIYARQGEASPDRSVSSCRRRMLQGFWPNSAFPPRRLKVRRLRQRRLP